MDSARNTAARQGNTPMTYFARFFAEKAVPFACWNIEHDGATHIIDSETVISMIDTADPREQADIKRMLVKLDFANAPVLPFLRHLAECFVRTQYATDAAASLAA